MTTETRAWIGEIVPLHEARDAEKLAAMTDDMALRGWTGRAILAIDTGDGFAALTGSHRIAAAKAAGLEEIPVYAIDISEHVVGDDGDCEVCGADCWVAALAEGSDDDDRRAALERSGDAVAVALMAEEED